MAIEINTNWDGIRNTNPKASVIRTRKVLDTLAIRVESAELRLATVSNVFELADIPQPFSLVDGELKVEVKCLWYDRKPPTTWSHLTLGKKWELIRNYSGDVADNIGEAS
jgi:hypothetical protein